MKLRPRSVVMEERSSLVPGLEQGSLTQVAEGGELKLQQENREGGENSKNVVGVGSTPSIAMRGELQGGRSDSGASPSHMDCSEIPPSPPPQAPVQGPDRAAFGISKAAEAAVPANDSVESTQTQSPGDCVDDHNLLTRPKGKSSAEGRINDSHDPHGFSKNLDPIGPAPAPRGSHCSHEVQHGSPSQSQMPRAEGRSGHSAWIGLSCQRCKSTNFSIYTDANAESVINSLYYQCKNCTQQLYPKYVGFYKHSGSEFKAEDRVNKGASQHTRSGIGQHRIIQAMNNLEPSKLAASNSNMKAMPPPSNSNMTAMQPPSNPNMKLMPPPSYTREPNVRLPDSQDTTFRSAKTTLPPRNSSCSDKLEDDHPSREPNLQLVVAPEPEERFPMKFLEARGPFPLSANLKESPSNHSAKGNQKETSFADNSFSVKGLRDSIRGHRNSTLEENKNGSGGGTISDGGRSSNGLPCPSCKCTNTRFCLPGRHYCNNCRKYWTFSLFQQHEVQLPSKQFSKGKEKEKETQYEDADQFSGKGLGDSSSGLRSLPLQVSEDGDGGSNEGPLNAHSCSRCKSTFTRLCTYGVFCDACGKHSPFAGTRDREVPANPPVATVHEVFDADGRSREHQMQSLPPPRRPVMVDASTQTDPVAMVPVDSRLGKHIVHGLPHTHSHQQVDIDERKRRKGN